jgi:hypothetical protein
VSLRPSLGEYGPATPGPLAAIPQGWKRALMAHQAENVTPEYGWQEYERILGDAETKRRALLDRVAGQPAGQATAKMAKSNAPRRTRTPSLLIRSQSPGRTEKRKKPKERGRKRAKGPRNQWDIRGDSATIGERRCAPARVSRVGANRRRSSRATREAGLEPATR